MQAEHVVSLDCRLLTIWAEWASTIARRRADSVSKKKRTASGIHGGRDGEKQPPLPLAMRWWTRWQYVDPSSRAGPGWISCRSLARRFRLSRFRAKDRRLKSAG